MDKGRALVTYVMGRIRERQGSPELYERKHLFWEALRLIEKNNWQKEASFEYKKELKDRRNTLKEVEEAYYNYLLSSEKDETKEDSYKRRLQGYNTNGELEELVKFKASHDGKEPTSSELSDILDEREKEDNKYRNIFYDEQIKIYFGETPDLVKLSEATRFLDKRGLLKMAFYFLEQEIDYARYIRVTQEKGTYKDTPHTRASLSNYNEFSID